MDRNRETRRAGLVTASNGSLRRRHRSSSLRDSPDEEGAVELQESARLRERVKKDRDRDRDRERDRERERERERDRSNRNIKRRRGDRLSMHEDGVDDSSEGSVNDDEDDDDEDNNVSASGGGAVRLLPPNPPAPAAVAAASASLSNHHHHSGNSNSHHHNQHQQRKSFPPNAGKVFRAAPVWKPGDEMIGVSVPRKARTASTKRSHDWISGNSGGGNIGGVAGDQILRQASTSPVRQSLAATSTPSPAAPLSPSSSNASARKKIKSNGPKLRPPKSSSIASSTNPEELEIEIAEVLYGLMTQSQGPSKKENAPNDTREVNNRSSSDAKSRVSSPVSNTLSMNITQPSSNLPSNYNTSAPPLSAIAPKRKRPRQVLDNPPGGFGVRSSPISSATTKVEIGQTTMKTEVSSPNLEKTPATENPVASYDFSASINSQSLRTPAHPATETMKVDSEAKLKVHESEIGQDLDVVSQEEPSSPKRKSSAMVAENSNREGAVMTTATKVSAIVSEMESLREEKFQIDLMAPPPRSRSSPEREAEMNFGSAAPVVHKPIIAENIVEMKHVVKEKIDERVEKEGLNVEAEEKKAKAGSAEVDLHRTSESSARNINLQLDLEKPERDSGKFQQQSHKLQQQSPPQKATRDESFTEKAGQSSSLPLPMSMASWPGGLPPMGYMAPLQGMVTMDGSAVSSAPVQPLFSQPRPKRCATHCYIARNIHYLQQLMKMQPFWPPAAGSAPFFGPKNNLNLMPSADLHGNFAGRGVSAGPDKAQGLAIFPSNGGKDKAQPASIADAAQRKQQMLLQQAMPPVPPSNLMHAPAFIFPFNQQQAAAAAAAVRPGPGPAKSPSTGVTAVSSNTSNPPAGSSTATAGGAATAISFNYPNMPPNEAQYLAILQNNAYAFPIPAVGAPPNYRGTHAQPLPLFNGSFYPSQMIHPSQVQQQQQLPPASQSQHMQQGQQNTSLSSGSSSSQKHLLSQQQRSQGNAVIGGNGGGNMHNYPGAKNRPSQPPAQLQNQHIPPQARQIENEAGREDSPSTAESRGSRGPINVYNQNFSTPIHPSNYGLMTPQGTLGVGGSSGNHQNEKKPQQQMQPGLKATLESVTSQPFAMSFASINGASAASSVDLSMAQNRAIFQSLPEATRQNIQMLAAAASKNFRISDEGKSRSSDQSGADDERKSLSRKPSGNAGQSIAFSRSDMSDVPGSTNATNNVDNSSRSLNLVSGASWTARAAMPNSLTAVNLPNAQFQAQFQHQQQQMIQLHKQHQQQQQLAAAAAARSKTPTPSNGSVYSDHLTSSASVAAKFPNAISAFPQNLVQTSNNNSPTQSPQWKSSTRTSASQSPSLASTSALKNLPQQQVRSQQSHTQISFGTNQKSSAPPQGQQPPNSNQSPSSSMMVGSPTTSISKGGSGSPRTNSTSTSQKSGQNSSLLAQQGKLSPSVPNQKSSPAGGRNVPSILGNPQTASTSGGGNKPQIPQQQQQQLLQQQQQQQLLQQQQHVQKGGMQQAQLFFSSPYMQAQPLHSTGTSSTASATGGYYVQRRRSDQPAQPQHGSSAASSSSGMLTLCPVSLGGGTTSDPAKAIAAATVASNMKGGVLPSQGILHAAQYATPTSGSQHQFLPAGYSYVHTVPAGVQVKPDQKQPAGNDNLHACWQPEKK